MQNPFKLTLRVIWWMQLIQILFALVFTARALYLPVSLMRGSPYFLSMFIVFVLLAYLCWANALSTIQLTDESVTVTVFYGRFRIYWNEIDKIVLNRRLIALMGNNKRVVLSLILADKNAQRMLDYFNQQIEMRNIRFEENGSTFPITHQNARVWR